MERFARTKCQEISKAKRCILLFHYKQPLVAWASKRQCPREALFKVVKVVQVVFPFQQAVLETQVPCRSKYRCPLFRPFFRLAGALVVRLLDDCRVIVGEIKDNLTLRSRKWRENIVPLHLHSR